jgi:cytochrome c
MSRARHLLIGCTFAMAASVLLARVHPFGDAGLFAVENAQAPLMEHSTVPLEVREILTAKCADCHSTQTRSPIYGRLAPVSWLMERDILRGREAMNLALWDTYSESQQQTFAAKIVQETKSHEMPLLQYRAIHWNSSITDADLRSFAEWTRGTSVFEEGSNGSTSHVANGSDAIRGKAVYEKRCTGCHAMTQDREGPRLQGVYGRISGTVAAFGYSTALKKANIVWKDTTLEQWLADPDAMVPGNDMEFRVAKPDERRDLVQFLKQSSGK